MTILSPIPNEFGYISVQEFKTQTNIKVDDFLIQNAIKEGARRIFDDIYCLQRYTAKNPKTRHSLFFHGSWNQGFQSHFPSRMYLADYNLDGENINKDDFRVFEIDTEGNIFEIANSEISKVIDETGIIEFTTEKPTATDRQLFIEYVVAGQPFDRMKLTLERLNKLHAVNYLFENVPFNKLQKGISNWSINGVSVQFDHSAMMETKTSNLKEIKNIRNRLQPFVARYTTGSAPDPTHIYGGTRGTLSLRQRGIRFI